MGTGDAGLASRWWPDLDLDNQKNFQKAAPSTPAQPVRGKSTEPVELSDPLYRRRLLAVPKLPLPVADMRRPHLRSLTAIAWAEAFAIALKFN